MVDSFTNCNQVSLQTRTGQLIVVEPKLCQLPQLPNLGGNGTCQRISVTNESLVDSCTNCNQASFNARTGQPSPAVFQPTKLPNLGGHATCQHMLMHKQVGAMADSIIDRSSTLCNQAKASAIRRRSTTPADAAERGMRDDEPTCQSVARKLELDDVQTIGTGRHAVQTRQQRRGGSAPSSRLAPRATVARIVHPLKHLALREVERNDHKCGAVRDSLLGDQRAAAVAVASIVLQLHTAMTEQDAEITVRRRRRGGLGPAWLLCGWGCMCTHRPANA